MACWLAEANRAVAFHNYETALFLAERAVAAAAATGAASSSSSSSSSAASAAAAGSLSLDAMDVVTAQATAEQAEAVLVLATCHYHLGNVRAAHHAVSQLAVTKNPKLRYLHARCCLDLQLYQEGEATLRDVINAQSMQTDKSLQSNSYWLLGQLCRKSGRKEQAVAYFRESLQLNPFMWGAIDGLCQLGEIFEPETLIPLTAAAPTAPTVHVDLVPQSFEEPSKRVLLRQPDVHDEPPTPVALPPFAPATPPPATPAAPSRSLVAPTPAAPVAARVTTRSSAASLETPRKSGRNLHGTEAVTPAAPLRTPSTRRAEISSSSAVVATTPVASLPSSLKTPARAPPVTKKGRTAAGGPALSSLASTTANSLTLFATPAAPALTTTAVVASAHAAKAEADRQARQHAIQLLRICALVQVKLSQFLCKETLVALEMLPPTHMNTGWALCAKGRAYYESVAYDKAEQCFDLAFRLEPFRSKGLVDVYSNVLWQLRKDIQLSFLAHTVEEQAPKAAETWIAVGNCFSLQKEHDAALRCFQRSLQIDASFANAYTLSGWEYVEHDDFEKAISCFRNAIRVDPRHYSAWYWLGVIYNHQEKFDAAEFHFRHASEINPSSATVWCHLGMVLGSMRNTSEALQMFARAENLDPDNPLVKFRRARVYISIGQFENAVKDLEITRVLAPREAAVYRLLADLYRKLGRQPDAIRAHTVAMDLDPKGTTAALSMTTDDDFDSVVTTGAGGGGATPSPSR